MIFYNSIYERLEDGDVILTKPRNSDEMQTVIFTDDGIDCNGEFFKWDYFFQANDIIKVL